MKKITVPESVTSIGETAIGYYQSEKWNEKLDGMTIYGKTDADDGHPDPARFLVALQNAEQHQIDQSAREGHADADVENVHQHIGQTRVDAVHRVHARSEEEEGEFKRFGDTRDQTGQRGGQQQTADDFALFGTRRAVHRKRGARRIPI